MKKLSPQEQITELCNLQKACDQNSKIGMIKSVRTLSPLLGLVEAKTLVEKCMGSVQVNQPNQNVQLFEAIKFELADVLEIPFTKEQFMSLVSHAYDSHKDLFIDP